MHDKRGITLIELVVVMAVLSVLAAVAMPTLKVSVKRGKEMELRRDLRTMRDAMDLYKSYVDAGRITKDTDSGYPKTLDVLVEGVDVKPAAPGQNGNQPPPPPSDTDWSKTKTIGDTSTKPGGGTGKMRFLRKVPVDPMTGKDEWGMRSNSDEPDSQMWGMQDVFDVYSQSEGVALDGTNYKDW
jgi:general secretion pathway protein G